MPFIDIFLNPKREDELESKIKYLEEKYQGYFRQLSSVYPALFGLLWHSSLPCTGLPAALVQSCQVAGQAVDCTALFTKVPTDSGLCCSLNTGNILKQSEYGKLVENKQQSDKHNTAATGLPVAAGVGMKKGVKLVLDLHSDQRALWTVQGESRKFQVFVGQKSEFPVLQQRSLPVQPGAEHRLDLSATSLTTNGIRGIKPEDRHCYFQDEGDLDFYEKYSYKSCILECKIRYDGMKSIL